ncbi:MAG: hypothetical protein PHR06_14990, partial [Candidatus Cloacimonetes bacterium]|nr:hypothetical protein [Candidatus Cloacimonadota bacterium]
MKTLISFMLIMVTAQIFSQKIDTWERRYGDELSEKGKKIIRTTDSNYLISCNVYTTEEKDMIWLIAIDQNGDSLWTRKIGGGYENFYLNDLDTISDGNLYFAYGKDSGSGLGQLAYVSKKSPNIEEIWTKEYWNMPSLGIFASAVTGTADSGCVVTGIITESFDSSIGFLEKFDKDGNSVAYHQLESTLHDSIFIPYNRIEALMSRPGMFEEEYVAVGNMQTPDKIYPYIKVFVDSLNLFMENIVSFENLNYLFEGFDVLSNKYVIFGDSKMFDLD